MTYEEALKSIEYFIDGLEITFKQTKRPTNKQLAIALLNYLESGMKSNKIEGN